MEAALWDERLRHRQTKQLASRKRISQTTSELGKVCFFCFSLDGNHSSYLHILRRMEKENQFKDWDEEEPFTHDQDRYRRDYVQLYSEVNCYAYTQYKFASSYYLSLKWWDLESRYSVMMRLLQEIQNRVTGFKPIRILDFGSGPGAEIAYIYRKKSSNQLEPSIKCILQHKNSLLALILTRQWMRFVNISIALLLFSIISLWFKWSKMYVNWMNWEAVDNSKIWFYRL